MIHEGGCLCGQLRFKAEGPPLNVRICHCRLCQKAVGAPFFARALFEQKNLTLTGPAGRFPSSERIDRVFCTTCGTRIGSWRKDGTAAGIAVALFDNRHAFVPTEQIWGSERIAWMTKLDDLPQYQHGPPA